MRRSIAVVSAWCALTAAACGSEPQAADETVPPPVTVAAPTTTSNGPETTTAARDPATPSAPPSTTPPPTETSLAPATNALPDLTSDTLIPTRVVALGPTRRSSYSLSPTGDRTLWAVSDGLCIAEIDEASSPTCVQAEVGRVEPTVSWSPDGTRAFVASSGGRSTVAVWVSEDGLVEPFLTPEDEAYVIEHAIDISGVLHLQVPIGGGESGFVAVENGSVDLRRASGLAAQYQTGFRRVGDTYLLGWRPTDRDVWQLMRLDGENPVPISEFEDFWGHDVLGAAGGVYLLGSIRRITAFRDSAAEERELFAVGGIEGGPAIAVPNLPDRIHQAGALSPDGRHVAMISTDVRAQVADGDVRFEIAIATVESIVDGAADWHRLELPEAPAITNSLDPQSQVLFWPTESRLTVAMSDHVYEIRVAPSG